MKVLATLDGQAVTIVEINIEATKVFITYILDSTQQLFVVEKHRNLPGSAPTLIATAATAP